MTEQNFKCNPPETCFSCPFPDCRNDIFPTMMAMKDVVNSRDVARWYARLGSVLSDLEGGKTE